MNQQPSHIPNPKPPKFRVLQGLSLELNAQAASVKVSLTPDEAISLAMLLLYEAREKISSTKGGAL